jgi:hypothetical protein
MAYTPSVPKLRPSPPSKSSFHALLAQVGTMVKQLEADYPIAWDGAYDRRRSSFATIGAGSRVEDDGAPSNSLLVHLADTESQRASLEMGSRRVNEALTLLRSAQGLVDPSHKPSSSNWTPADLRQTEARFHDASRGSRGRKRA